MMRRTPKLGQHFLTGQWAARRLAEATGARPNETILEIGPGRGALTRELLKTGARVIAVEKDEALVQELEHAFVPEIRAGQLRIVCDDIRDFNPASYKLQAAGYVLAANIPYYITGEIIRQFLESGRQPRTMALLLQKEVAQRIVANSEQKTANRKGKESILSVSVKAYGVPRIVAKVSRGNFSPPPKVDSAILLIERISKKFFADLDEAAFFRVVRTGFSSKRKFLANNLASKFGKAAALAGLRSAELDQHIRAEDVPLRGWKLLAKHFTSPASGKK